MAIKIYKRATPGKGFMSVVRSNEITDKKPEKSLMAKKHKRSKGRSWGKISVRHKGGGHKRRLRVIDFTQDKFNVTAKIVAIEKDPNRSALIALVSYKDGEKRYILATEGMRLGKEIITEENAPIKNGNRVKLKNIPVGTIISNVELFPGRGGQIVRSAGSGATLMAVDEKMAQVKMASGEIRFIDKASDGSRAAWT